MQAFRNHAACALSAIALIAVAAESYAKDGQHGKSPHAIPARSYIPSECSTLARCTPAAEAGKPPDGRQTCSAETHYKHGKREGLSRYRLNDGGYGISWYRNDKQHGHVLLVDAQGQVSHVRNCEVDGQRREARECDRIPIPGYEKAFERYQSKLAAAREAQANRRVEERYADGQVWRRYRLVNGVPDGKYEQFYRNGNPSSVALYRGGSKVEETEYFEEGQVMQVTRYAQREPVEKAAYYRNGRKKSEWRLAGRDASGARYAYREYFGNGRLAEEGRRYQGGYFGTNGTPDGEVKVYSEEGELLSVAHYDKGMRAGTWKYSVERHDVEDTYRNGRLHTRVLYDKRTKIELRHTEYMPDGSVKAERVSQAL